MNKIIILFFFVFSSCSQTEESDLKTNSPLGIQSFKINQSWSQKTNGYERNVFYKYPENDNKINPVAKLLHGSGATMHKLK